MQYEVIVQQVLPHEKKQTFLQTALIGGPSSDDVTTTILFGMDNLRNRSAKYPMFSY